jgi:hypothetical protein
VRRDRRGLIDIEHSVSVGIDNRHERIQEWPVALFERPLGLQQPVGGPGGGCSAARRVHRRSMVIDLRCKWTGVLGEWTDVLRGSWCGTRWWRSPDWRRKG